MSTLGHSFFLLTVSKGVFGPKGPRRRVRGGRGRRSEGSRIEIQTEER